MSKAKTAAGKTAEAPQKKPAALPETAGAMPWLSAHEVKKESNPFTERDWRMLVYAWSGLVIRITLVLGAIFSVYQYLAAREEKRVERSLELVELWEQPDYQAAQRALKLRIGALNERYASLIGENPTAAERAVYASRIGMEALTAEGGTTPTSRTSSTASSISSTACPSASRADSVRARSPMPISAISHNPSGATSPATLSGSARPSRRPTRCR